VSVELKTIGDALAFVNEPREGPVLRPSVPLTKTLEEAREGDVFEHDKTGAVIVVVQPERYDETSLITVQLNTAEGHDVGWVSLLRDHASGWRYVRTAS
jgi:hypothetical protein